MSDAVLYETRGPAAWITLNRPEKLNALNHAVVDGLHEGLGRAVADDEVKVVVLTGAGRAFSAGYDIGEEVTDRIEGADDWHRVLETRRQRNDGALVAAKADDRSREGLVPRRRLRPRDGVRPDRGDG